MTGPADPYCPIEAVFGPDDRMPCRLPRGHDGEHEMAGNWADPCTAPYCRLRNGHRGLHYIPQFSARSEPS